MAAVISVISGSQIAFQGNSSSPQTYITDGRGSIYTMVCNGTIGQTAKLQGSIDGTSWVDIVEFTIDSNTVPLSETLQFSYPMLQVSGTATLKIARG